MMLLAIAAISVVRQSDVVHLEDLDLAPIRQEWSTAKKNKSVGDNPLRVAGKAYDRGIGTHANGVFTINLKRSALRFDALCGADDEATANDSVTFEVWVDGVKKADTPVMHVGDAARTLSVDLKGAKTLELRVTDGGNGIDNDHADWLEPTVTLVPGATAKPETLQPPKEPAMKIASGIRPEPRINGASVVGCSAGKPFLFRIPCTGQRPLTYAASGLPAGLALDAGTGIISGAVATPARTVVHLTVRGPRGTAERDLTIDSNGLLALTPPMGWNSWNVWAGAVNQQRVQDAGQAMIDSGLADVGYSTVNIDDTWEGPRGADGMITANQKFPDMKGLADSLHAMGLHIGIYSGPGPTTCAGFPASYRHEKDDATAYAKWGFDYLKYDWCSYGEISKGDTRYELEKPYLVMSDCLRQSGRDIVFSLCQYGMGDVWNWGRFVGGNLWRTTGDINDSWGSMSDIAFAHSDRGAGIAPGGWNDPDMLVVGRLGWGDNPHPTHLTPNEQITHITMWSLLAAPLLIGCDMTHMDQFTKDVLENPEVVDVDQDPLGHPATRLAKHGDLEVWGRRVVGGWAIGLMNRGPEATEVSVDWAKDLKVAGRKTVRDLWLREDKGQFSESYSAKVPAHGANLILVRQ